MNANTRPTGGTAGHHTTRRWLLRSAAVSAAGAAGGAMFAGCGPAGGGDSQLAHLKSPVTVRLGERAGTEEQAFDNRLPSFKEKFPNITVVREAITGDMIAALQTMNVSGTLPDSAHCYTGSQSYHNFAVTGAFIKIDDRLARDKVDMKGWFPEMLDIMRIDGKLQGLPFKGQVLNAGFYYNISLFEKRGIPVPNDNWTYDDLLKAAQQLTIRQGSDTTQWGYALQTWGGENFTGHLRPWGGDTYSKDGKRATLDTAQVLEAMQWYDTMFHKERVLHPIANAAQSFYEGKVGMIGRTYFNFKTAILTNVGGPTDGKFKWDGAMMPKLAKTGKRGGMFAGDAHAVTRDSKNPDAAFELLKWATDKEFGVQLGLQTKGSTTLGGRPDVYADPRIVNHNVYTKQMQQAQMNSVNQIKEPSSAPANFRAPDVERVRDPAITQMANGETRPEPGVLKQLNSELQVILDMPRP